MLPLSWQINRIFRNGSDFEVLPFNNLQSLERCQIDYIGRNIYFTHYRTQPNDSSGNFARIDIARLDGSSHTVLIDTKLERPSGLAIYPPKG